MQMREKVGKSRNTVFFPMICGFGGSKSRLAKAAGAEPSGQTTYKKLHAVVARSTFRSQNVQNTMLGPLLEVAMWKKCTPLWRGAHFEVKMYKTPCSDHFWKLRCWKSARCCGAKHISKSKCTKHTMLGPLLEVAMLKKCTLLRREAHFEVKMYKTHHARTTFGSCDVEKVHAVVARSTFRSQNVQNTPLSDHFWKLRCRKSACCCGAKHISKAKCTKHTTFGPLLDIQSSFRVAGERDCAPCQKWAKTWGFCGISNYNHHYTTLHSNTLHCNYNYNYTFTTFHYITLHYTHYTPLHYTQLHSIALNYTTLHYTTLHSITLHYITLHYTTFHYTTLHYTTLHYTTLPSTTLHYTTPHYTTLHYTTLHYLPLHFTTLHYTPQHYNYNYTTLHSTPLHSTTLHYTTLHYTTLHYTTLHYTTFHYTSLHYTTLHSTTTTTTTTQLHNYTTTLHYTPLHSTTLHFITLHYPPLHYTTLHNTTLHYMTLHYTQLHCNYNYNYTPLNYTH